MSFETIEMRPHGMTPIDTVQSWFNANGWTHEKIGDEEVV
ncbi:MAG: hypothetical protein RL367_2756, partial [Pseudomonadota bacterium]